MNEKSTQPAFMDCLQHLNEINERTAKGLSVLGEAIHRLMPDSNTVVSDSDKKQVPNGGGAIGDLRQVIENTNENFKKLDYLSSRLNQIV